MLTKFILLRLDIVNIIHGNRFKNRKPESYIDIVHSTLPKVDKSKYIPIFVKYFLLFICSVVPNK